MDRFMTGVSLKCDTPSFFIQTKNTIYSGVTLTFYTRNGIVECIRGGRP